MGRPKLYADAAARKAAQRARGNVTQLSDNVTPDVTISGFVTCVADASRPPAVEAEPHAPGFVAFRDCPDVPHDCRADPWIGAGRGTERTYKGRQYALVARGTHGQGEHEHGVVSAADWHARLPQRCAHGLAGWSCHGC